LTHNPAKRYENITGILLEGTEWLKSIKNKPNSSLTGQMQYSYIYIITTAHA